MNLYFKYYKAIINWIMSFSLWTLTYFTSMLRYSTWVYSNYALVCEVSSKLQITPSIQQYLLWEACSQASPITEKERSGFESQQAKIFFPLLGALGSTVVDERTYGRSHSCNLTTWLRSIVLTNIYTGTILGPNRTNNGSVGDGLDALGT